MKLTVEVDALEYLAARLADSELGDGVGLRLMADGSTFELVPDRGQEHDRVFEVEGRTVLLVDPQVEERVADRVLEIDDGTLKLGWAEDRD